MLFRFTVNLDVVLYACSMAYGCLCRQRTVTLTGVLYFNSCRIESSIPPAIVFSAYQSFNGHLIFSKTKHFFLIQ